MFAFGLGANLLFHLCFEYNPHFFVSFTVAVSMRLSNIIRISNIVISDLEL